jgi:hypothetical protein
MPERVQPARLRLWNRSVFSNLLSAQKKIPNETGFWIRFSRFGSGSAGAASGTLESRMVRAKNKAGRFSRAVRRFIKKRSPDAVKNVRKK